MLCRALLTVVAISCTLSRETAQVQGTQRLVQIKDLLCVLLLSGLQKDDLDVNTLKKLQRHNVNIDDMNNANFRQECLSSPSTENSNIANDQNKTTMETYTFDNKRSDSIGSRINDLRRKNLEDVMKYLMHNMNNNNDNTDHDFTIVTEIVQNQPKQKSILKNFKFARINTKPQTSREKVDEIEIISTPRTEKLGNNDVLPAKDVDYISGFLAEYIAKIRISTTPAPPKSKHVDDSSGPQQLNGFINVEGLNPFIRSLLEQKNKDNIIDFKKSEVKNNYNIHLDEIINKTKTNHQNIKPIENPFKIYKEESRNKSLLVSLDNINMLKEIINNFNPFTTTDRTIRSRVYEEESDKLLEVGRSTTTENVYTKSTSANDKQDNSISMDIIKEIARTIKDIIIKDLKKEITTETTIMTSKMSTTTELTTTTTAKIEKAKEATHVIEKIMEMFQQLKTIKESTIITSDGQLKMTEKKDLEHVYTGPVKVVYQTSGPGYPYNLIPASPLTQQSTNTFVARNIPQNINSLLPTIYTNPVNVKPAAITMQTNLNVIPPLGIPVQKPMDIINQNIIVTTKNPIARGKPEWNYRDYNLKRDKKVNGEENKHRSERLQKHYLPKHLENYDNSLHHFRGTHRYDVMSRVRDTPSYERDPSHFRSWDYKTHFDHGNHYYKPRNDAKNFHERLEADDWSHIGSRDKINDRDKCRKLEVVSRQQLPLNNIKKVSNYDDTHFKNFLKTQQKVNAMLERILATKTNLDGLHGDDRNIELT